MLNQKLVSGSKRKTEDVDPSVVLYLKGSYDRSWESLQKPRTLAFLSTSAMLLINHPR